MKTHPEIHIQLAVQNLCGVFVAPSNRETGKAQDENIHSSSQTVGRERESVPGYEEWKS